MAIRYLGRCDGWIVLVEFDISSFATYAPVLTWHASWYFWPYTLQEVRVLLHQSKIKRLGGAYCTRRCKQEIVIDHSCTAVTTTTQPAGMTSDFLVSLRISRNYFWKNTAWLVSLRLKRVDFPKSWLWFQACFIRRGLVSTPSRR